jgi:predicted Rossmann fold flavoprotein
MLDICIIGGGAAGLAAAVTAGRENPDKSIFIIEKKDTVGKKLAATGNGKCNLTNVNCSNMAETLMFFDTLGIFTRTDEEGRVYPYCSQARDVVYALEKAAVAAGCTIKTDITVEKIEKTGNGFLIKTNGGNFEAVKVLIATGGKSAPQFGTSGDGYTFAKQLGHTVNRLSPVLTGIEVREDLKSVKGVRIKALVKLLKDGQMIEEEYGEVQFNEDGISGICVMNLSRFIKLEDGESFAEGISRYSVELDMIPEMNEAGLQNLLERRVAAGIENTGDLLLSLLPDKLRNRIAAEHTGLRTVELCKLSNYIKRWPLSVKGTKGWKIAQCTSGGVTLNEIDPVTMESSIVDGLYFAGEVMDYDGPCGGYNLQNAWETGIKAGRAMANDL